jgi:hypothetical protein
MSSVTEDPYIHKRTDTGYMESESSAFSSQLIDALPVSGVRSKVGRIEQECVEPLAKRSRRSGRNPKSKGGHCVAVNSDPAGIDMAAKHISSSQVFYDPTPCTDSGSSASKVFVLTSATHYMSTRLSQEMASEAVERTSGEVFVKGEVRQEMAFEPPPPKHRCERFEFESNDKLFDDFFANEREVKPVLGSSSVQRHPGKFPDNPETFEAKRKRLQSHVSGRNVFVRTCPAYPANDSVVPTVEIGPSPAGVRAAALTVVTSICPERTDTGRPPDTVIATCDYFNFPLNVSHLIPPPSLDAGQAMRLENDSWA